jgi:hypothetical protein
MYQPSDFIPYLNDSSNLVEPDGLNHWSGTGWHLFRDTNPDTGPWTIIDQLHGHPNGTNSLPPPSVEGSVREEHWPIRRWVSDFAGQATLIAEMSDANLGCGTGTSVELYHNGMMLNKLTTNRDDPPASGAVGVTLQAGDFVDLALTPEGLGGDRADPCDSTNYRLTVTDEPPPPPPPAPIPPYADSLIDWSTTGTQGRKNWFYGYYNLTQDGNANYETADFIPFTNSAGPAGGPVDPDGNHWSGTQWDLTAAASGPWTELGPANTHPNGTNSLPNEEHWTIRRFVASDVPENAPVEVVWETRKTNLNGDGVTGILFVNGNRVDEETIAGNDGVGVTNTFNMNLKNSDIIELAHTPVGITNDGDGADGSANRLTIRSKVAGDFDGNLRLTDVDIDLLSEAARLGSTDPKFDVNADNAVNQADRTRWISELRRTHVGDSNLDGVFSSSDLVAVFTIGLYETGQEAGWAAGDWDGNGRFDSSDFVAAFTGGGYEQGPLAASSVPEPASWLLIVGGGLVLLARRRRKLVRRSA